MKQLDKLPDDPDGFISIQLHPAGSDNGDQVSLAGHPCWISRKDPANIRALEPYSTDQGWSLKRREWADIDGVF
jgi:hypothetical protein